MNEQVSWIFYRYAVGFGTLFLGIAAIFVCYFAFQISKQMEKQTKTQQNIELNLYNLYMFTDRIEHSRGSIHVRELK